MHLTPLIKGDGTDVSWFTRTYAGKERWAVGGGGHPNCNATGCSPANFDMHLLMEQATGDMQRWVSSLMVAGWATDTSYNADGTETGTFQLIGPSIEFEGLAAGTLTGGSLTGGSIQ
jgi:hypothetical protein